MATSLGPIAVPLFGAFVRAPRIGPAPDGSGRDETPVGGHGEAVRPGRHERDRRDRAGPDGPHLRRPARTTGVRSLVGGLVMATLASGQAGAQSGSAVWHHACACWTYADISLAIVRRAETLGTPAPAGKSRELARLKGELGLIALEHAGPLAIADPTAIERAGAPARASAGIDPAALSTPQQLHDGFRETEARLERCRRRLRAWGLGANAGRTPGPHPVRSGQLARGALE